MYFAKKKKEEKKLTQASYYKVALEEVRSGRKRSHWIWYIFPQIQGLGFSVYILMMLTQCSGMFTHLRSRQ
ncbi:DUF1810 family protein [Filimonas lacunae]|uniref:DUF1810 family protein n=1 Tax=Filimonas lacunae TaxID=477680 RepID=UPI000A003FB0|nr:DUF1810 family protein [Filimonas lacunae]